mgnify:FL=1
MKKGILAVLLFTIILTSSVSALTGSLGNAKMFLNAEVGETLEKYVLVKNVNNVSVNINLDAVSDISKDIKLEDNEFELEPGEERRAYFTIKARKPGVYEIRIQVRFSSLEEGKTGVGLSSIITLKVYGKGEMPDEEGNPEASIENEENLGNSNNAGITGAVRGKDKIILPVVILLVTTLVLALLLFIIIRKNRKTKKIKIRKRSDRSS